MNVRRITRSTRGALILILASSLATPALAQRTIARAATERGDGSPLDRPARLDAGALPLQDALTRLSETSGVTIAFSPSAIQEVNRVVGCSCAPVTVGEALERLLAGTSFEHSEFNGQVIVFRPAAADPGLIAPTVATSRFAAVRTIASDPRTRWRQMASGSVWERAARQATVTGRVTDISTGDPLSGVQVSVVGTQLSTITNEAGVYRLTGVPEGTHDLRAQRIGYSPRTATIEASAGESLTLDFRDRKSVV